MKRISKKDLWLFLAQVVVWGIVILALPLASLLSTHDLASSKPSFFMAWGLFHGPLIVYFANFYIFGPYLFFRRKFWWFALCNILLLVAINNQFFFGYAMIKERVPDTIPGIPQDAAWTAFLMSILITLLMNIAIGAIAIGIRHFIRTNQIRQQLRDEKAKNTEAELAWLKNQINPHFLFNTLNNISSLTQIDPDAAQDAIAQLSDLLRYAMYETNKKTVPITGEVEFMRNYISLMKLRCNEKTEVVTSFDVQQDLEIAPLLFISLIENAFKHGVSSSRLSKIDIRLLQEGNQLIFNCDNTNYPKDDADRSGSGIGLENTRRRLDLMYAGHYQWEQSLHDDIYHVKITLKIS
jgi:hypothetical protein